MRFIIWAALLATTSCFSDYDNDNTEQYVGSTLVVSPHEALGRVSVSTLGGSTVLLPGSLTAAEDAKFCTLDGTLAVVGGGEGKHVKAWFRDSGAWSASTLVSGPTSLEAQRWMQVACAELDGEMVIWGTGRSGTGAAGRVGYFTSPTPRVSGSWTWHFVGEVGWGMSLEPVTLDDDEAVIVSDADCITLPPSCALRGTRYLKRDVTGAWVNTMISQPAAGFDAKFIHVFGNSLNLIDTSRSSTENTITLRVLNPLGGWLTQAITPPTNVGQIQDITTCDLDGNADVDLVATFSHSPGTISGVKGLLGPSFTTTVDIAGTVGEKFDNAICRNIGGAVDAVFTSEQADGTNGMGVGYYELVDDTWTWVSLYVGNGADGVDVVVD